MNAQAVRERAIEGMHFRETQGGGATKRYLEHHNARYRAAKESPPPPSPPAPGPKGRPLAVAPGAVCPLCTQAIIEDALVMATPGGGLVHAHCFAMQEPEA